MSQPEVPPGKTRYRYFYGTGSWHQRKAGHFVSAISVIDHTPEEHERYKERHAERYKRGEGESLTWVLESDYQASKQKHGNTTSRKPVPHR